MQNSSEFQYIAIDQIHESSTNPRRTFDEVKLGELAESIRTNGLIQPITVRPTVTGFEVVAGARRFRAAQLAELFSLPARIVAIDNTQALEWQLVENSQRVDVHPYEEAQGFQRLLNMPGYDVAALVEKSGKSAAHVYARLSLLQLVPAVAEAFSEERITASHANLLARLPQDVQVTAYEQCWRKDWQDKEPHLLPAKHLASWIQTNLYLSLAEAPFRKEDETLNPPAGPCITCPKRSGYNTSLFADVQGDQCLDGACYQTKVAAYIDRELTARPQLVQIETTWRPAKEQRPGVLPKHSYRELPEAENPDAEPSCPSVRTAMIVYGRHAGTTLTVCTDDHCPVHDPATAARIAKQEEEHPSPVMAEPEPEDTEQQKAERIAAYEQEKKRHEDEARHREEERKADFDRQQKEYAAEQEKRDRLLKARRTTFERIVEHAPETFRAAQLRLFLRLVVSADAYNFLEEVANHFATDEDRDRSEQEIVLAALDRTADDTLTGFALRLVLTDHVGIPQDGQPDPLTEATALFAPPKKASSNSKAKPTLVPKKAAAKKLKAA